MEREKLIALLQEANAETVAKIEKHEIKDAKVGWEFLADYLIFNGVAMREKGEWKPCFICTGRDVDNCMQGEHGWECSVCGEHFDTQYDYCVCGADMRKGENNG